MTTATKPAPDAYPLVGASEAASLMGVELSTFSHLRRREESTENSKFPKPLAVLRCGPIWKTTEIKKFALRYEAPRPGPKPTAEVKPVKPIKKVAAKTPAKAAAKAAAGNGGTKKAAPTTKVAAKKAPARRTRRRRTPKVDEPATV